MEFTGPAGAALRKLYEDRLSDGASRQVFSARKGLEQGHATSPGTSRLRSPESGENVGLLVRPDYTSATRVDEVTIAISNQAETEGDTVRLGTVTSETGAIEPDAAFADAVVEAGGAKHDAATFIGHCLTEAAQVAAAHPST